MPCNLARILVAPGWIPPWYVSPFPYTGAVAVLLGGAATAQVTYAQKRKALELLKQRIAVLEERWLDSVDVKKRHKLTLLTFTNIHCHR